MAKIAHSIPGLLESRAQQQPDDVAYTFIDYDVDPAGYAESVTWSELHDRARVVAEKLSACGVPGDRAVVLAPQSMEYIVALFGAIQAGFVAVPLPMPQHGHHDERVSAALLDCTPVAVLTTSAVVDEIRTYTQARSRQRGPRLIEVDTLDFDSPAPTGANVASLPKTAYLQYTSGSTRTPAGVVVTHDNVVINVGELVTDYFEAYENGPPADTTVVSWLPFYHDMGLVVGLFVSVVVGCPSVLMSPVAFMQKPARWIQQLASNGTTFTAAPNFSYELAVRRTSDDDMAGLDLGGVAIMINGAERVHGATVRRFNERFGRFNLPDTAMRPSYGLAEATVYVSSSAGDRPPTAVRFDLEKLSAGHAERCGDGGSELISCGTPRSTTVRIVDPDTRVEKPAGQIGEIWLHGDHVAGGYWRNPELTERLFTGQVVEPSAGTPQGPWVRTGDLGVMFDEELFIIGRIKDLLIVDGRNHYPDDIEATIQEITGGRVAAISIPDDASELLVAIAEVKRQADFDEDSLRTVKRDITSAISMKHSVRVSDVVLVPQQSLPLTTSGKVRRATCVERYRLEEFSRLDVST